MALNQPFFTPYSLEGNVVKKMLVHWLEFRRTNYLDDFSENVLKKASISNNISHLHLRFIIHHRWIGLCIVSFWVCKGLFESLCELVWYNCKHITWIDDVLSITFVTLYLHENFRPHNVGYKQRAFCKEKGTTFWEFLAICRRLVV